MNQHLELVRRSLRGRGLRMTAERKVIVEEILSSEGHFDAEGLARNLQQGDAKVSRATVYRTVACLVDLGLLRRYELRDRPAEYEATLGREHHEHMICVACGAVVEFVEREIERLQDEVCRRFQFQPLRHTLQIHGLCEGCADRGTATGKEISHNTPLRGEARG